MTTTAKPKHDLDAELLGQSKMARLILDYDWEATALGAFETWPAGLRSVVALVTNSQVPIVLLWGERGYMIYSDSN